MKGSILTPQPRRGRMGPPTRKPAGEPAEEVVRISDKKPVPHDKMRSIRVNAKPVVPTVRKLPDPARAEKGLTLRRLLKQQPAYQINSAEDVVVRSLKPTKTKSGLPAYAGTVRDMNTKPMCIHKFQVFGMSATIPTIGAQKRIKVSCNCPFFMYYSEYALWTWGAANIRHSNGAPAVVRNPGNHPILCKHLTQVLMSMLKHSL